MSIGDKEVYPLVSETITDRQDERDKRHYGNSGLTYREWLIGMLASNSNLMSIDKDSGKEYLMSPINAVRLISQADAIIKQLDKEVK